MQESLVNEVKQSLVTFYFNNDEEVSRKLCKNMGFGLRDTYYINSGELNMTYFYSEKCEQLSHEADDIISYLEKQLEQNTFFECKFYEYKGVPLFIITDKVVNDPVKIKKIKQEICSNLPKLFFKDYLGIEETDKKNYWLIAVIVIVFLLFLFLKYGRRDDV